MADRIFNKDTDNYVFTGSTLRAPTSRTLRLSSASNEAYIDLCANSIVDISAASVKINTAAFSITGGGTFQVEGGLSLESGLQIGSGLFGGKIYKSANPYELVIDPFSLDLSSNVSDASGQVTIMGDLVVYGNTTTFSSTNVDISDIKLTLASGGASGNVNGAGIELGKDGYASMLWNSSTQSWAFNKGMDISGGVNITNNFTLTVGGVLTAGNYRPASNYTRIPSTLSNLKIKYGSELGSDISSARAREWVDASGWILDYHYPISWSSQMKIEARITYISSPEADQTLSFKIQRYTGMEWTDVCTDLSLGTNMGVTLNSVHTMMFYASMTGFLTSIARYKLQFMRNCPVNDTISTPFGIQASSSNIMTLEEIVNL